LLSTVQDLRRHQAPSTSPCSQKKSIGQSLSALQGLGRQWWMLVQISPPAQSASCWQPGTHANGWSWLSHAGRSQTSGGCCGGG
jgi:hypothetical protein